MYRHNIIRCGIGVGLGWGRYVGERGRGVLCFALPFTFIVVLLLLVVVETSHEPRLREFFPLLPFVERLPLPVPSSNPFTILHTSKVKF
ncbi:unnamed protein product [Tuber melanosporum]|uniref:(Perigord truffle) hypothetical protein n=1 Tax=Tuber melanosporum (strain Mel28) TaxID=656061 RepID=D5GGI1_TUBMM|nr:uncharacterized protein GSTUM_00007398001 [Tuber melanosporum]CAZ83624.1 unnamed protein product [Tuber melanosporum]